MFYPANTVNHCLFAAVGIIQLRLQILLGALMFCRLFAQCLRMGDNQRFLFRRPCGFILVIAIAPTGIGVFQSDAIFLGTLGERS